MLKNIQRSTLNQLWRFLISRYCDQHSKLKSLFDSCVRHIKHLVDNIFVLFWLYNLSLFPSYFVPFRTNTRHLSYFKAYFKRRNFFSSFFWSAEYIEMMLKTCVFWAVFYTLTLFSLSSRGVVVNILLLLCEVGLK